MNQKNNNIFNNIFNSNCFYCGLKSNNYSKVFDISNRIKEYLFLCNKCYVSLYNLYLLNNVLIKNNKIININNNNKIIEINLNYIIYIIELFIIYIQYILSFVDKKFHNIFDNYLKKNSNLTSKELLQIIKNLYHIKNYIKIQIKNFPNTNNFFNIRKIYQNINNNIIEAEKLFRIFISILLYQIKNFPNINEEDFRKQLSNYQNIKNIILNNNIINEYLNNKNLKKQLLIEISTLLFLVREFISNSILSNFINHNKEKNNENLNNNQNNNQDNNDDIKKITKTIGVLTKPIFENFQKYIKGLYQDTYTKKNQSYNNEDIDNQNNHTQQIERELSIEEKKLQKKLLHFFSKEYYISVINEVKKTVKGRDDEVEEITFQIFVHYMNIYFNLFHNRNIIINTSKNILIKGETGTGKTLICKTIAQIIDVPYVISDCTAMTATGYVGDDVENAVINLFNKTNKNYLETEKLGIIILDEFDKIASTKYTDNISKQNNIITKGVQNNLLKIIEGTYVNPTSNKMMKTINILPNDKYIRTHDILFIGLGTFPELELQDEIDKKFTISFLDNKKTITKNKNTISNLFNYNNQLIKAFETYGFIAELLGRFTNFYIFKQLKLEDYKNILLNSIKSPLKYFQFIFEKCFNYEITLDDQLIDLICVNALNSSINVRALEVNINYILKKIQYDFFLQKKMNKIINQKTNKKLKLKIFLNKDNNVDIKTTK